MTVVYAVITCLSVGAQLMCVPRSAIYPGPVEECRAFGRLMAAMYEVDNYPWTVDLWRCQEVADQTENTS